MEAGVRPPEMAPLDETVARCLRYIARSPPEGNGSRASTGRRGIYEEKYRPGSSYTQNTPKLAATRMPVVSHSAIHHGHCRTTTIAVPQRSSAARCASQGKTTEEPRASRPPHEKRPEYADIGRPTEGRPGRRRGERHRQH